MTLSIRQRVTFTYSAAVAVLLGASAVAFVMIHSRLGALRQDSELQRLTDSVHGVFHHELDEGLTPHEAAEDALSELLAPGRGLLIFTADGTRLAERWQGPSAAPPEDVLPRRFASDFSTVSLPDGAWRVAFRSLASKQGQFVVAVAAPIAELNSDRATVLRALGIIWPLAIALFAACSWWVSGQALRPAAAMAEETRRIGTRPASARLTVARPDELGRLAMAFNALLDRLEQALDARRLFLADASHELRTPVTVARTAADLALTTPSRREDEYRDTLKIVSDQMRHLGRIIADMLVLARSDAERWPLRITSFYAEELAAECVRAMSVLANERGVHIRLCAPDDLQMSGDEELLRQLLGNLLENAVAHSSSEDVVQVTLAIEADALILTIHDHGPGVAAQDRDRIFDRFVRTGSSLSEGTGLGLAIARRIARGHGGELTLVDSDESGTTFRASIPISPDRPN